MTYQKRWMILITLLLFCFGCQITAFSPSPATLSPTLMATRADSFTPTLSAMPTIKANATLTVTPTTAPTATPTINHTPTVDLASQSAGLLVQGAQTIGDPYSPELGNGGYLVSHYTLRLSLDPAQEAILAAHVTITAQSTLENLGQFSLDFVGFSIDALQVDGKDAQFTRQPYKLVIALPQPQPLGHPFAVDVTYHGKPVYEPSIYVPFEDHQGLRFMPELNRLYVVSEPDGSRYWFPCNDHPRNKASFTYELTVPEKMVGVANGDLMNTQTEIPNALPDGRAGDRYTWEAKEPMATYLATVAVGDYVRMEGKSPKGIPLRSYVFRDQQAAYRAIQPRIGQMVDWMSDLIFPYPFTALGYVSADNFPGALEAQTMIVTGNLDERTLVHELAHQWFGDWVSLDNWGDIWRNEGIATYFESMWMTQDNPARMAQELHRWQNEFNGSPPTPLNNMPPKDMFSVQSYDGGAWLMSDLRAEMGDDAFFKGLRMYVQQYGGRAASTAQFQSAMEKAAGKSLSDFFKKWLTAP